MMMQTVEIKVREKEEKEEVLDKVRRGRACQRREKRMPIVRGVEVRLLREKLYVGSLNKAYRQEARAHQKIAEEASRRGIYDVAMPEYIAQMKQAVKVAEENIKVALISREAVKAFPPLT